MTRENTIKELRKYFDIRELVSKAVYVKFGEGAWRLFDTRLLETLLALRVDILKVPLVCNNWKSGGSLQQRGFRENTSAIVSDKTKENKMYLSAHTVGQAVDLSSSKMTADIMRNLIVQMKNKLPHKVRIEKAENAPTWLHIDVMSAGTAKIEWF